MTKGGAPKGGRRVGRLEVVADGLPLFGGAQIAVDTTLVSALHCDGSALIGAANRDRGCIGSGQTPQGAHIPGISCPVESLSFGGHGQRSWRQMVVGSLGVLVTVTKGECEKRDSFDAALC